MARIPRPISTQEAEAIRYWIRQVGPEEGVLAAYEVTAPLSSRKRLFSYILDQNKPSGFPQLGPEFQWVFLRNKDLDPTVFLDQGFDVVYRGDFVTILQGHRKPRPNLKKARAARFFAWPTAGSWPVLRNFLFFIIARTKRRIRCL